MPGLNAMMKMKSILVAIAAASLTLSSAAFAQTAQMTGQIIALTSDKITVQKGKEVWDINLSASTKVSGDKSRLDCDGHLQCAGRSKKRISLSAFGFRRGAFLSRFR
jgi:opacity protein-like surface antigen